MLPNSNPYVFNTPGTYNWVATFNYTTDGTPRTSFSRCGDETIIVVAQPNFTVTKTCPTIQAGLRVGATITYNVVITNTGDVPLTGITVTESRSDAAFSPSLLARAGRRQVIVRMLLNLKRLYVRMRSFPQARLATHLLVALSPSSITELRDRGLLAYHVDDLAAALRDLEEYLRLASRGDRRQM